MFFAGLVISVILSTACCADELKYEQNGGWKYLDNNINNEVAPSNEECNFPPSVWCSSHEVARRCQVELQCEQHVWSKGNRKGAAPVQFGLYFESLCPDCREFIGDVLWPAWKKVGDIMDLQLIPYGNAREIQDGQNWKFECQHGADECLGNLIETCSIHIAKNISIYFPFIHCIENSDASPAKSAPKCAEMVGIDYNAVSDCVNGPVGNQLEHQMAVRTDKLQPPHTFVPWITLNGVHTDEIQTQAMENPVKLICDTYKGVKPEACESKLKSLKKG